MLKVLYLLNHAGKAGTERYVQSLIEKLCVKSNRIKAYFAYNEEGLLAENLRAAGIETFRIVMRHPFDLRAVFELSRLCRRLEIDIIHTHYLRENYISLLSRLINPRVKVIYTNHFILKNNAVVRMFNRMLSPLQAGVISVCSKGRDMLIANGIDGRKIRVIFNGVDPDLWGQPCASTMREEFGIGSGVFVLLCASRFAHDKGHKFLIDSIAELKKTEAGKFKCVLANDGPLLDECRRYAESIGLGEDIIFTGFRRDIKNLIAGSDLYVNSSAHEALSFAIIEVLACGIPVIATNMGGNDDIINPETNCGLLVEYGDAKGLAQAIARLMHDAGLLRVFRDNALKTVREKFNLDKTAEETYNLYLKSCSLA